MNRQEQYKQARAKHHLVETKFHLADGDLIWDGYASGMTWNGWDEIAVTPEVRSSLVEFFKSDGDAQCCPHPKSDHPEVTERFMLIGTYQHPEIPKKEIPITGMPCAWQGCDCAEWNDGMSGLTDFSTSPSTGLVDLVGWCTTIHGEDCMHDEQEEEDPFLMNGECTHRFADVCNASGEHLFYAYRVETSDGRGTHYGDDLVAWSADVAAFVALDRHGLAFDKRAKVKSVERGEMVVTE